MTTDTPEACPFCGAGIEHPHSTRRIIFQCGVSFWHDAGETSARTVDCYERAEARLCPKAEVLDRLEEIIEDDLHIVQIDRWGLTAEGVPQLLVKVENPETQVEHIGEGPDLASAINAAYQQWKGEA